MAGSRDDPGERCRGAARDRSIGHGPPDEAGRLEVGYEVDPAYRQQGYARESATAMYNWAHEKHGLTKFVASVAPDNIASLHLIEEFGYTLVGEQVDEIDGLKLVFETSWPPPQA